MRHLADLLAFAATLAFSFSLSVGFWREPAVDAPFVPDPLPAHGPVLLHAPPGGWSVTNCWFESGAHALKIRANYETKPCAIIVSPGREMWLGDGHRFVIGMGEREPE